MGFDENTTKQKIVPGDWAFKIKRIQHGIAEKCKPRFVAEGFAQAEDVAFGESIYRLSRLETFGLVLASAAQLNLLLEQLHLNSALLHTKLKTEVFIEQPKRISRLAESDT